MFKALNNYQKAQIVDELSGQYDVKLLLKKIGLPRSSYYYARKHPPKPTRPELWEKSKKIFARTSNGCGHRQILMCLRAEIGCNISKKTVLKMMREIGLVCQIRRKKHSRYSSYRGNVGKIAKNVIKRDFHAQQPWQKMGTDVTEFTGSWGKAYFAPIYDFCTKEIVAWSVSKSPDFAQQKKLLGDLLSKLPKGVHPILHSDMGWQYQQVAWVRCLKNNGIVQSMSRKGNCLDNAATEQVFGHLKDEFYRGQRWDCYESFEKDLNAYIFYWNHQRRQIKFKGMTPVEYRYHSLLFRN